VLPREPAHPAAEGESADPGVRDVACRGGQTVRLRGLVERAEERTALNPGAALLGIDADAAHRREVDHEPVLRNGEPQDGMPAAAHADLEIVVAGKPDRGCDVVAARAADDRPRAPVDHGVPDSARFVTSDAARHQQPAIEPGVQFLQGGSDHAGRAIEVGRREPIAPPRDQARRQRPAGARPGDHR
jgi:hypothetical protein